MISFICNVTLDFYSCVNFRKYKLLSSTSLFCFLGKLLLWINNELKEKYICLFKQLKVFISMDKRLFSNSNYVNQELKIASLYQESKRQKIDNTFPILILNRLNDWLTNSLLPTRLLEWIISATRILCAGIWHA